MMRFNDFLKDSFKEFKIYHVGSLKMRINHVLGYIHRRQQELIQPNKYVLQKKVSFNNDDLQQFIRDYISYLEKEMNPVNKLPKEDENKLIKKTIINLKKDYLNVPIESEIFIDPDSVDKFNHYLNELDKTKQITYSALYNEFTDEEYNNVLIKCKHDLYTKWIQENYLPDYRRSKSKSQTHFSTQRLSALKRAKSSW